MPELVEVMFRPPTPTTTPKLQLDFFDLKSSWSLGVVVVVGGSAARPPPPPPLNSNFNFLDLENFLVKVWGGGGGGGGVWHQTPPHHP